MNPENTGSATPADAGTTAEPNAATTQVTTATTAPGESVADSGQSGVAAAPESGATTAQATATAEGAKDAAPEKYDLKQPEGSLLSAEAVQEVEALAREAGLSNEHAQKLLDAKAVSRQVQVAADFAKGACARLAGVDVPKYDDNEKTLAELKARCQKTRDFLATLKPEQFEGSDTRVVKLTLRGEPVEFVGLPYLTGFALPNFYFHMTTAYALLRQAGVPLGKSDFVGGW